MKREWDQPKSDEYLGFMNLDYRGRITASKEEVPSKEAYHDTPTFASMGNVGAASNPVFEVVPKPSKSRKLLYSLKKYGRTVTQRGLPTRRPDAV